MDRKALAEFESNVADDVERVKKEQKRQSYLAGLAGYSNENKAGPLSDVQQSKDYALSRDPLAEGDADVNDPRWQRLTGNTPADSAERDQQSESRDFIKFAGLGAAGELAAPLVARGVGSAVDGARNLMAPRTVVIHDPAALAPTQVLQPPKMSAIPPRMGRLNAEGAKGGAISAAEMSPREIEPVHQVHDQAKVVAIADSMRENGWKGDPILVVNGKAWTGTHRLAAAEEAGIPAQVYDWHMTPEEESALSGDMLRGQPWDQDSMLSTMENARDEGVPIDDIAHRLYRAEIDKGRLSASEATKGAALVIP